MRDDLVSVIEGQGVWAQNRRRAAAEVMDECRRYNRDFNYDDAEQVVDWSYQLIKRARAHEGWMELTDEDRRAPEYPYFSYVLWPSNPCNGEWRTYENRAKDALETHCLIGIYDRRLQHRFCECGDLYHTPAILVVKCSPQTCHTRSFTRR